MSATAATLGTLTYCASMRIQQGNPFWDVFPWAALMLIGTCAAWLSALAGAPGKLRLFAVEAALVLGLIGVVSIYSVGIFFIAAALAAGRAAHLSAERVST